MVPEDPKRTLRDELHAGGTTLGTDGGFPWLLVGVGGAAALAAVVWWVAATGDDVRPTPAGAVADVAAVAPAPTAPAAEPPAPPPPAPVADPLGPQRAAAASFERALAGDQLWATVDVDGASIVIRSAFCADAGLAARLAAEGGALRGAGFTGVRCMEQHGSLAFERPL
jgi:hypothetical protein